MEMQRKARKCLPFYIAVTFPRLPLMRELSAKPTEGEKHLLQTSKACIKRNVRYLSFRQPSADTFLVRGRQGYDRSPLGSTCRRTQCTFRSLAPPDGGAVCASAQTEGEKPLASLYRHSFSASNLWAEKRRLIAVILTDRNQQHGSYWQRALPAKNVVSRRP